MKLRNQKILIRIFIESKIIIPTNKILIINALNFIKKIRLKIRILKLIPRLRKILGKVTKH